MLGFRVWDSVERCFIDKPSKEGLFISDSGELIAITATFDRIVDTRAHERFIVMQATGTKDLNGNMIYEGDVVHVMVNSQEFNVIVHDAVEFIQLYSIDFDSLTTPPMHIEGNIYENPEYLS